MDDFSTDGTRDILKTLADPRIKVFYPREEQGQRGGAPDGFRPSRRATSSSSRTPTSSTTRGNTRKLLEPILDGRADVVYGSRFLGGPHRVLFFWHYVANRMLTTICNILANLNLTDMETCYKVFKKDVLSRITLKSDRFGFEPEVTIKVAKLKARIYEVPISYSGRDYTEGKKIGWKDGVAADLSYAPFKLFSSEPACAAEP